MFLEAGHEEDKQFPVARTSDVTWVDRKNGGEALIETVAAAAFDAADHFGWVACDNRTTRAVSKVLREDYKIPKRPSRRRRTGRSDGGVGRCDAAPKIRERPLRPA
jgi:NADPH-dependent ferric siderophore reductase